jgi:hypothetical protein
VQRWQSYGRLFGRSARVVGSIAGSALNWASVLTASDEGSAAAGILLVYGCRAGPKLCLAAALTAASLAGAEQRHRMIDRIRDMHPDDPYGNKAEQMIKDSCLYFTAACRQ